MLFPEYKYFGFKTAVAQKTKIYSLDGFTLPEGPEAYASVYLFGEDVVGLPSLADIPPSTKVYPPYLLFDFDSKDLSEAYEDAKTLIKRLDSIDVRTFLWFSGNKGFHVGFLSSAASIAPTENVEAIKEFADRLAGDLGTWDPSVYNKSRIFRCSQSYNQGGQRYKVLIETITTPLEVILTDSLTPRKFDLWFAQHAQIDIVNDTLSKLYLECVAGTERKPVYNRVISEAEPHFGGSLFLKADEGRRNETAYTVARKLARRGLPLGDARAVMELVWNPKACNPPLSSLELQKVVENAYSKGVNEFIGDEGSYEGKILSISEAMAQVSRQFVAHQTGFLTGYPMIDDFTMGFGPEELIWIAGRSGNFKSAVLTNILQRGSKLAKKPALYFSMEMGPETLVPRTIQQSEKITKKAVVDALRAGKPYTEYTKTIEDFEYVKFIYLSNLTTEQVVGLIDFYMEKYGELSAVGFDYLGLFRGVNNHTERTAKQAQELKTVVAKAARCPVFCLTQAKQVYEGREGDIELDRTCPKDSDSILDLGDYALGLWGHWDYGMDGHEEKYIFGRFFKARGMNSEAYGTNPYFGLVLDKKHMALEDVAYIHNPPQFKQKGGNNDERQ